MTQIELIKAQVEKLYRTNPKIHMDVSLQKPKLILKNAEAKITGVYPNLFQIEESTSGTLKSHVLQYTDIHTKNIVILELQNK